MVEFNVNVGDPDSGKTFPVTVEGQHANVLVRKQIGDEVDGMFLGLPGYKVEITGGTDRDGFPMRPEFQQAGRKKVLVSKSIGFKPKDKGVRKKRAFRGNEISPEITQINCRITQRGPKPVAQLLGAEEAPEETPQEAPEEAAGDEEEAPQEASADEEGSSQEGSSDEEEATEDEASDEESTDENEA